MHANERRTTQSDPAGIPRDAKLSIIVPVFNEGTVIAEHLRLLLSEVQNQFADFEVIVVSDGSTDRTSAELLSLRHPGLTPLIFERNTGKGNAVRSGFKRATGNYILFIDGGMEIHPREIRIFVGLMDLYDSDIVIGSKRHPQSRVNYPWYRHLLSWLFQKLVHRLFDVDVTDTQVGIKLFKAEVVHAILPHLRIDRYGFDLELLSLASRAGYRRILEAPIRLDYFAKNRRPLVIDLSHVLKVGLSLLSDTFKLHRRLKKIEITPLERSEEQLRTNRRAG
jgi:glycosyltransferase involved in cell wall biosynthesis